MGTRIVFGIVSAVVASTLSILVTATDEAVRAWSAATGTSIFVTALCLYALLEIRALRGQLAANEERTRALISALEHDLQHHQRHHEQHDHHDGDDQSSGHQRRGGGGEGRPRRRRPPRRGRPPEPPATGTAELLSQQFQMYLRGRDSRRDDDPPMTT